MNVSLLKRGQVINDLFEVKFFLKKGSYAETYRVSTACGEPKLLKLFFYSRLDRTQFNDEGEPVEIDILRPLSHANVVKYFSDGIHTVEAVRHPYVVLDFISGETIADRLARDLAFNRFEAKSCILDVLKGLSYLHSLPDPVIHNDLNSHNVMFDMAESPTSVRIIDFGYARLASMPNRRFQKDGLNPFYQAPETFNRFFSRQSDLFSAAVLYYHLLEGRAPWHVSLPSGDHDTEELEERILASRQKPLGFNNVTDENTKSILRKALDSDPARRFATANELIEAIRSNRVMETAGHHDQSVTLAVGATSPKSGGGFDDIAGMEQLKETLRRDVINALQDKERYLKYKLSIPNGILLYGPPGCGKTFFAEKLAEEIGFRFFKVNPSDIQSKWVNASQENIKNLFAEARQSAPAVVFIDELDALVPNRNDYNISHMNTSAVNEFLVQLNNCGEDDVFVIGATNRPGAIDPAILRKGRLDKAVYVPVPDFEARKLMLKLYLEPRPIEFGINYDTLAMLTQDFVASDIKFITDEAARVALSLNVDISNGILFDVVRETKPSLSASDLGNYQEI